MKWNFCTLRSLSRVVAVATLLVVGHPAAADSVPALGVDPGTTYTFDESYFGPVIGWTFYLTQPVTVTGLGWYDDGQDGLSHPHQIGIWKDDGGRTIWPYFAATNSTLLLSATIPDGAVARLDRSWRVLDFNVSLTLEPGGYEIAGTDNPDNRDPVRYVRDAPPEIGSVLDPQQGLQVGAPGIALSLVDPASQFYPPGTFIALDGVELGPMFFVEAAPEPSSTILLAAGLCWLFARRRRRPCGGR